MTAKRILITGGAGFIGSAVVRQFIRETENVVINVDALTYAGNPESLAEARSHPRHVFEPVDIRDRRELDRVFRAHKPDAVMHLAAESHVDRSIEGPGAFVETNVTGTHNLLEAARHYWSEQPPERRERFRFHHVSTDEVYGDLGPHDPPFTEASPYAPSSPYAASKAASDHLVRAWHRTYGLPVVVTNCSNNYGPYQFPEKLIPLMILNALEGKPLPVYGRGDNVRDWLYVEDHASALRHVLDTGVDGRTYNIGGRSERTNLEVVEAICDLVDKVVQDEEAGSGDEEAGSGDEEAGSGDEEAGSGDEEAGSGDEEAGSGNGLPTPPFPFPHSRSPDTHSRSPDTHSRSPDTHSRSLDTHSRSLITYVSDRPGHDRRYAIDDTRIATELGWQPQESFESGLAKTVKWYLDNPEWVDRVRSGAYREWIETNYGNRGMAE